MKVHEDGSKARPYDFRPGTRVAFYATSTSKPLIGVVVRAPQGPRPRSPLSILVIEQNAVRVVRREQCVPELEAVMTTVRSQTGFVFKQVMFKPKE